MKVWNMQSLHSKKIKVGGNNYQEEIQVVGSWNKPNVKIED